MNLLYNLSRIKINENTSFIECKCDKILSTELHLDFPSVGATENLILSSVLGNHDGWYDKYRVKKALENNGIKVLINSSTKFEDLYISGVDDLQTGYPEILNDSAAREAGFYTIPELAKERIRRAGKKIKEESPLTTQDLDIGFRVLKLDSSNMRDVFYTPEAFTQQDLFEDNIKGDRTEEDLLFQVMIELGIELSAKIEKKSIAGKTVWSVNGGYLMACFDEGVNESTIKEVAKQKPFYFVMRDSSLATDNVADNFEQIWSEYSNDTVRRII